MKNNIIFTTIAVVFSSVLLVIITNLIIVSYYNEKAAKEDLMEYLSMTELLYHGDNDLEVSQSLHTLNVDIRLTIIDLTGEVLFDSSEETGFDSHLGRPEIETLGTIYKRYSNTLKQDMIYVASRDDGHYVRIALPVSSINHITNTFIMYGVLSFSIISLLSFVAVDLLIRKALFPLHRVVAKMQEITHEATLPAGDDVDAISMQIDDINKNILQKIEMIGEEKDKLNFILDNINQGIIVLDYQANVVLINQFALDLFEVKRPQVLNKHFIYGIRQLDIQEKIQSSLLNKNIYAFDYTEKGHIYYMNIAPLVNKWVSKDESHPGAVFMVLEVTERRQIELMKKEFFANASHELKSPLTTIIGYQQMLAEGILKEPKEVEDAIRRTLKEANRMHQIVNDMLELSHLEGKPKEKNELIDASLLISEALDHFKLAINEKHLIIETHLSPLPLWIHRNHLVGLFHNLLDNAIKYNKEGGSIILTTTVCSFTIQDTGIGIPKEDQSRVFERFYRVDKGRSQETGGTGLGLAIVKHICSLYEATIKLRSQLNQGTTIQITFSTTSIGDKNKILQ
ncbi:MAG: ATP-binding protein [Bacilli bacterium]|nr:ATP-binding protein [Bacilli bacterium]